MNYRTEFEIVEQFAELKEVAAKNGYELSTWCGLFQLKKYQESKAKCSFTTLKEIVAFMHGANFNYVPDVRC